MYLVTDQSDGIGEWISHCLGQEIAQPYNAIGVASPEGKIIGGWLLNNFNGYNADLTIYAPGAMTRRTIRACYAHLFLDHRLIRATASTRRANVVMRNLMPRLGFQFEALQRRYYGPHRRDDAFTFVLFKDNALKWINPSAASKCMSD